MIESFRTYESYIQRKMFTDKSGGSGDCSKVGEKISLLVINFLHLCLCRRLSSYNILSQALHNSMTSLSLLYPLFGRFGIFRILLMVLLRRLLIINLLEVILFGCSLVVFLNSLLSVLLLGLALVVSLLFVVVLSWVSTAGVATSDILLLVLGALLWSSIATSATITLTFGLLPLVLSLLMLLATSSL